MVALEKLLACEGVLHKRRATTYFERIDGRQAQRARWVVKLGGGTKPPQTHHCKLCSQLAVWQTCLGTCIHSPFKTIFTYNPQHRHSTHPAVQNGVTRSLGSPEDILTVFKSSSTSHGRFRTSTNSRSRGLSVLHFDCKPHQSPQRHTNPVHFKARLYFRIL